MIESRAEISSIEHVLQLEQKYSFSNVLKEFEEGHGKPFEEIPFVQKEPLILARLDELVRVMRVNPLLRERLDQFGVTRITDLSDWYRVPITTREDLNILYTSTKNGLVIPFGHIGDPSGHKVIASGGSSGDPIITIYRTQELREIGERAGKFWRRCVVGKDGERVTFLNLFDNQNGWASNELVQNILEGIPGSNTMPVGSITLPRVADFFLRQGVTDVVGLPSNFSHLVRLIESEYHGVSYPNVVRAVYGGEFMDPVIRDQLQRVFPNIYLVSVYSSTQADHIAVQVEPDSDFMRISDDINFLEIIGEDGLPVADGEVGRIIVTRLLGNGDQPLRLDLQDLGSIKLADSADRLQSRKLRLLGRTGDYLRISTWDIRAEDLLVTSHNVLKEMVPVEDIQARQLVVDDVGVHLNLAVEDYRQHPKIDPETQHKVMRDAAMQSKGFFDDPHDFPPSVEFTINFVGIGDLERTPAGKIHPFLNKRSAGNK